MTTAREPDAARRPIPVAALVLLAALSAALHAVASSGSPPDALFAKYLFAAEQFLRGELSTERAADFSPLYLALHVVVQRLTPDPLPVFAALQIAAASASTAMLFLAARAAAPTAVALAAAAALQFSPSVMIYTQVLEPEILLLCFLLGFALCIVRDGAPAKLAAGAFFALGVCTRPSFLALAVLVPAWLRLVAGPGRRWRAQAAIFLLPLAVVLGLAAAGRLRDPARAPGLVMNPGVVFFEGNNPLAGGLGLAYPPLVDDIAGEAAGQPDYQHAVYRLLARRARGRELSVGEVNRYWIGKALAFVRDEPGLALRRLAAKALVFFHQYRRHDVHGARLLDQRLGESRLPRLPFAPVAALAVLGLALLAPAWRQHAPYFFVLANQLALALTFYVTDRQRVAAIPFFIYFAAAAASWALRSGRRLALTLALVAPLACGLSVRSDAMVEDAHLWDAYTASGRLQAEAARLRDEGDPAAAADAAAAALARTPWMSDWIRPAGLSFGPDGLAARALTHAPEPARSDFSARLDRAILLVEAGRNADAERLLLELAASGRRFARVFDGSSRPEFYLAVIAASRGDRDGAARRLREALAHAPGDPFALSWLAALSGEPGPRALLHRYFDDADAAFLLGQAHLALGDAAAAVAAFSEVGRLVPEFRRGRIYLAAALGAAGRFEEAARVYLDAVARRPEPVLLESQVRRIFEALAATRPESAEARAWGSAVHCQFEPCPR